MDNDKPQEELIEGQPEVQEGTATAEPTTEAIKSMYEELGIKAPAPTGATKGRPKSSDVRAKNSNKDESGDTNTGEEENSDNKGKSKDAPSSNKDGNSGDNLDEKSEKVGKDTGKVSDKPEKTDSGVRKTEPGDEEDTERGSKDDSSDGAEGTGRATDNEGTEEEESEDVEKGKREGKSNPKVEARMQKLTAEIKARDEMIAEKTKQLEELQRKQFDTKVEQEDPAYKIEDFRKVRDETGEIVELDENQAELAWRRWKDGYDQRSAEREAEFNREKTAEEQQRKASEELMRSSVEAYDTLTGILETYPELNAQDPNFDKYFSAKVMPIIEDTIMYQEGTEPGNENGANPVIVGVKMNPAKIIEAMNAIRTAKRDLPLNGINDSVETKSNVQVSHGRSSDPNVNAANELYAALNIKKRI